LEKDEKTSKKYTQLLSTGKQLFWKYGFRRVSIEEICQEAGISKMTFYRFFPNKMELAKTVFDQVANEGLQEFRSIIHENSTASEKIRKIVLMKQKGVNDVSKEFLKDFYSSPELGLKAYIEEKTRVMWNEMLNDFRETQEKGWFRKDMKPEFLFYISQKAGEMLNDEQLSQMYDTPQELLIEITNFFAYGISPHE